MKKKEKEYFPFTDVSIHQNWWEFEDESGQWYRFEQCDKGIFRVYLKRGEKYIYEKVIIYKGAKNPRKLYGAYWQSEAWMGRTPEPPKKRS